MSRDPLPEPWRTALERRGVSSKRGLAAKAGISPQTAKRLIDGEGAPSPETVAAVADAVFDGDRSKVWELAGRSRQDYGDVDWPAEASQLTPEQRAAVVAVIRAMVPKENRGRGDGDDRDAASIDEEHGPAEPNVRDVLTAQAARRRRASEERDPVGDVGFDPAVAARRGKSVGRALRRLQDEAGEEGQDSGGVEPA